MTRTLQKRATLRGLAAATIAMALVLAACGRIPGRPAPGPEIARPEATLGFAQLYRQNCSACHGAEGRNGAAISLANPVYIAIAGENQLRQTIANGVPGRLMPAFARGAGGMLTGKQVDALAQGIVLQWGKPGLLAGENPPPYLSASTGNAANGLQAYGIFCARCHGAAGKGGPADGRPAAEHTGAAWLGSIVDPSYLALISDQNLRSITIAGRPDEGMPDWRHDAAQPQIAKPMTEAQIDDILAWLASQRVIHPGQPYPSQP